MWYWPKDNNTSLQGWSDLKQWLSLTAIDIVSMTGSIHSYWRKCRAKIDKGRRKTFDGIMIYFWWNVWKERNRRIFQNKSLQPRQVALLCKEEVEQYQLARGNNGSSSCYIVRPGFLLLSVFCFLFGVRWLTGGADGRETVLVGHLCRLV